MDFRIFTRGGEERWLAYACRSVWSYDGKPLGCRVSNRDITDRKRVEAALADLAARLALAVRVGSVGVWDQNVASNSLLWDDQMFQIYGITPGNFGSAHEAWQAGNRAARLALAVRAGGIGIWDWDIVANRLSWDHRMFQIYGITPDRFGSAYEAWRARLHPEDLQRGDEEVQLALRNEREFDTEFRLIRPDGAIRNIRALALVQRNAVGQPMHMIGINWDVTENKQAEEALRKSEECFRAIANYTCHWENWIGTDGKLIWVNPAVLPFTGYSVDECLAMADFPLALIAESDHEKFRQLLAAAAQGSSGNNREFRIRCKDGSAKEATISWQPIYDSKGVNLGHRSSIHDVTASGFCQ